MRLFWERSIVVEIVNGNIDGIYKIVNRIPCN